MKGTVFAVVNSELASGHVFILKKKLDFLVVSHASIRLAEMRRRTIYFVYRMPP